MREWYRTMAGRLRGIHETLLLKRQIKEMSLTMPQPLHLQGNAPSWLEWPLGVGGRVWALRHSGVSLQGGSNVGPAISQPQGARAIGPRLQVEFSGIVPTATSVALKTINSPPAPPHRSLDRPLAKGTGRFWKHSSFSTLSAGQRRS